MNCSFKRDKYHLKDSVFLRCREQNVILFYYYFLCLESNSRKIKDDAIKKKWPWMFYKCPICLGKKKCCGGLGIFTSLLFFFSQNLWKHPPVSTCILLPRQLKHTKVFLSQSTLIAHGSRWLQTLRYPVKPLWILLFIQWSFRYPCCPSLCQCCWHALIITAFSLNPLCNVLLLSNTNHMLPC